ncbi:MAG: GNAT family N-acetyltransferase [Paracoccaceae bacterium]|jgi:RimJ/RimL family protein N-acetyltransferase
MTSSVLETSRLKIRKPLPEDFPAFEAFCARDRSKWVGGPVDRRDAWEGFTSNLGHWVMRGYGYFHVEMKETGDAVGRVGLRRTIDRPETEVAFSLYEDRFEGMGLAYEAASAVRDHGYTDLELPSIVSYIHPDNVRSIALAKRMGAGLDPNAPLWPTHKDLLVFRHPTPEDLQ